MYPNYCKLCDARHGWKITPGEVFVCPRCIASIELLRESQIGSTDLELRIGDAKRALSDDAFLSELPPVPERGFVGVAL
jgi:hypothetical protein